MKYSEDGITYDEIYIKALDSMPIGSIISFAGEDIPTGWLVCDGDVVSSTDYPDLFAEIGNKYGGTSPSFKLPDLRGRVPVGLDPTDQLEDFDILGNSGGERTHTLTTDEMPSHRHTTNGNLWVQADGYGHINATASTGANRANVIAGRTENTGGNEPHNNLQPYLVVNFIIKAKNTTPTMASVVNATNDSTEDAYSCNYVNNMKSNIESKIGDVVWINLFGGQNAFGNKTITTDVSNYSYFEVYFFVDTNLTIQLHRTVQKGVDTTLSYTQNYTRIINIGDASTTFHSGYYIGNKNDSAIIPAYIVGYK